MRRFALALAAGLALGVATRYVHDLPREWWWLAKAGVPWLAAAFAVGTLWRRPAPGAAGGALALVAATIVYYSIAWAQQRYYLSPVGIGWLAVAVPGGMVFGALGSLWRGGRMPVLAVAVLSASFAAEALIFNLAARHGELSGPVLFAAAVAVPVALLRGEPRKRAYALAVSLSALAVAAEIAVFAATGYLN